jgi:replication factor C small subunit
MVNIKEHTLLTERYRPTELENYVGNENIKKVISQYLDQNDIQNLIFAGQAGTGKTTLAKLIVKQLDCDFLYINASDENGIETIRNKVSKFSSQVSFKGIKVVILDEADFLTVNAQASLRNIIETFSRTTRFIMTCNFVERIIDPLQSRCQVLNIVPPSKADVARHLKNILDKEKIKYTIDDLKAIVLQFYPDLRKCLNTIQASTVNNELTIDKSTLFTTEYMNSVLEELKKTKPSIRAVRQIIASSNTDSFEELYRFLYENAEEYMPGKLGMAAILINEHSYKSNFRIDKEINTISLIQQLINNR